MLIKKITLTGMSCSHCVHAVETVLEQREDIAASTVSIGQMDLTVNEDWDGLEELRTELEREGYRVQNVESISTD